MKTAIKSNWLIIVLMALVVCFTCVGIASLRVERGTTPNTTVLADAVYEDPTAGATELTTLKYDSNLTGRDNSTLTITNKFYLEKGASVRVNKETSGLRFTVWYGDVLDSALKQDAYPGLEEEQYPDNYPVEFYEYKLYMIFQKAGTKADGSEYSKVWVPINLYNFWELPEGVDRGEGSADWDKYQVYSAALNFGNLSLEELNIAKTWEIKASAVVVIEGKTGTEKAGEKVFFTAGENDNTRSMQAVANAAIVAGEDPEFINQLEGKPFVDQSKVINYKEETIIESRDNGNRNVPVSGIDGVTGIYLCAKKLQTTTYSNGNVIVDINELPETDKGETLPIAIFGTNGIIYNTPVIYADKAIKTAEDLLMFNIDDGDEISGDKDTDVTINPLIEGYYILGNDIVGTEPLTFKHRDILDVWNNTTTGFKGTFDGNGHYIKVDIITNGGSSKSGIFGQLQAGAVIKDVAFVECTMNQGVFLFSGIKNNASATLENVYLDIKATGSGTYGGSAWYQSSKLVTKGVFINNTTSLSNISNGKTPAQLRDGDIPTTTNHGHGSYVCNEWSASATNLNGGLIVVSEAPLSYALATTTTTVSGDTHNHRLLVGVNEADASYTLECGCDSGLLQDCFRISVANGVYHYTSIEQLSEKTSEIQSFISNYSTDLWDLSYGYPRFKSVVEKDRVQDVIDNAKFYLGESEGAEELVLENAGDSTSAFVYAEYAGMSFYPELQIIEGTSAGIGDGVIYAIEDAVGQTTVRATYVIAGVEFVKDYVVTVTLPVLGVEFRYSTLDQKLYASNGFDLYSVDTIVDARDNQTTYYNDGALSNIISNTSSTEIENYTKIVNITLDDGSKYTANLVSYTKVLTTASDFALFYGGAGATISGYYIMNNDIPLDSSWNGNGAKDTGNVHKFNGVFDGDGHSAEIALGRYGVFGALDGATVKNVAFIVKKVGAQNLAHAAILAYKITNSTIQDCYFEYDLPEGTTLDAGYYGWFQTSGIGLYSYCQVGVRFNNVVINTSKLELTNTDVEHAIGFGSLCSKADSSSNDYLVKGSNIYVISNYKYLSYQADVTALNGVVQSINGIRYAWFASNDTEAYENCEVTENGRKSLLSHVKRYDSLSDFANDSANNNFSAFNADIWSFENGYPEFNSISGIDTRRDILDNTEFYFAGSKTADHADLDVKLNTSASVSAVYNNTVYLPVAMEIVEGDDIVTVDVNNAKISVLGIEGNATVNVHYIVNGVTFFKTYTITVTFPYYDGKIMYSAMDDAIYLPEGLDGIIENLESTDGAYFFGDPDGVVSDDIIYLIEENSSAAIPERLTVQCLLETSDGDIYYINIESYTKVMMSEEDLALLVDSTATSEAPKTVNGYYVLGTDIEHGTWAGNTNAYSTFAGTFDGDGHFVELKLNGIGLFGKINAATIKNVAFIVNEKGSDRFILASSVVDTPYYIDNVYIDVNVPYTSATNWSIAGTNRLSNARYTNTIVDYAPGVMTFTFASTTTHKYGGGFESYTGSDWFSTKDTDYDGDGVNDNRFNYNAFNNTYVVSGDYRFIGWHNGGTAGVLTTLSFAENDGAVYASVKDTISSGKYGFFKGLKRYDDFSAMAGAGNSYDTFNKDVWDFSAGYPQFKSILRKTNLDYVLEHSEFYLGGSKDATEAELYLGEENNSIDVYASYKDQVIYPKLEITNGRNFVTIGGEHNNTVSSVAEGPATIKATYVIEDKGLGVYIELVYYYSINVITAPTPSYDGHIMYSSLDEKFYFPEGLIIEDIAYMEDVVEGIPVVEDGEILEDYVDLVVPNTDSKDLTDYTWSCQVELYDGSVYLIDVVSYTKVLTSVNELSMFAHANSGEVVYGYYIVANDLLIDENTTWTGNAHYRDWNVSGKFDGVFDGNGHTVELILNYGGVFGSLASNTVVKNVAFVVKSMKTTGSNAANVIACTSSAANGSPMVLQDVYVSWDLPEGTVLNTAHNGSGQDFGLGLFGQQPYYSEISNVVIDMTGVVKQTENLDFRYGALYAKVNDATGSTWGNSALSNVYVISQDKFFTLHRTYSGSTVNDEYAYAHFAGNDTDALAEFKTANPNVTKAYAWSTVKRYNNLTAFAQDKNNNDFIEFNAKVWDLTAGYPEFRTLKEINRVKHINNDTQFYFAGSTEATEATLEIGTQNVSINVYASLDGKTYIPQIAVEGDAVTASNGVITAVKVGTATVTATYDVEGIEFVKVYTVNVSAPLLNAEIRYSTIDGKLYIQDNKVSVNSISAIVDKLDTSIVYYADGIATESMPKNSISSDLTDYTKSVYVTIDGKQYLTTLVSYTKVLTKAEDLLIFNIDDGDSTVSSPKVVKGYYILGNDIIGTDPLTFKHADMDSTWNNLTTGFGGTFDGDGHIVTVTLTGNNAGNGKTGIFGQLQDYAVIKNVAFVDCTINRGVLLFSGATNNAKNVYVQNVYVNMTATTASTYGGSAWYSKGYINFQGIFIDNDTSKSVISGGKNVAEILAGDIPTASDNGHGTLQSNDYAGSSAYKGIIVISEAPLAYGNVSSKTTTANDTHTHRIAVGVNDGYTETSNIECPCDTGKLTDYLQIFVISNVYRYNSIEDMAGRTSEIAGILSNYSTEYWDLTLGYPRFKSVMAKEAADAIVENTELYFAGNEGATEANVVIGDEISAYATYNEETYNPTLVVLEGNAVTVNGNVITAVVDGTATVLATYTVAGVQITATYVITVDIPTFNEKVLYSTLDDKLYMPDFGDTVVSMVNVEDSDIVYYADGAYANISANTTNTAITHKALAVLANGAKYYVDIDSYTKVLMKEEDLSILVDATATKDVPVTVTGCYALGANIKHGTWAGNTNTYSTFAGTFDGNGHYVELVANKYGLFVTVSKATIMNTAFIVNERIDDANARFVLAQKVGASSYTNVIDCYFDINASYLHNNISILASNSAWYGRFTNVITDFAPGSLKFGSIYGGVFESYTSASWFSTNNTDFTGDGVNDNSFNDGRQRFTNSYYINSDFKYAGYYYDSSNALSLYFAENDGAFHNEVKDTLTASKYGFFKNLKRYDDFSKMAEADNDYSEFNKNVWDFTAGYPQFKSIIKEKSDEAILAQTQFYLGGSDSATSAELLNHGANNSISLYASFNSKPYYPTLAVVSGDTVTVEGSTITAKALTQGESVVSATYKVEGVNVTKEYTINVSYPEYTDETIKYSTLDNQIFLPFELETKEIVSIVDTETEAVYYADGVATQEIPQNVDSKDLTNYTKDVIINFADNTGYKTTLTSYTKVITKAEDFKLFERQQETVWNEEKQKNEVVDVNVNKLGYYILANDITLDDTTWTGNTFGGDAPGSLFKGVLDGNGHYAEIIVKSNGLFGKTEGAIVKNIALIVKDISTSATGATVLAQYFHSSTIQDSYVKYDLPEDKQVDVSIYSWGQTAGLGLYIRGSASVKVINTVIDTSSVQLKNVETAYGYGSVLSKGDTSSSSYKPSLTDTYIISSNKYLSYLADVTTSGNSITEIKGIKYAVFASNDEADYNDSTATTKQLLAGAKRYNTALDFAQATGNDYSSFTDVWDTTNGYPVWKGIKANDDSLLLVNGEVGSNALLGCGKADSVTIDVELDNEIVPSILSVVDGEEFVVIEGNVVRANSDVPGTATVMVKANVNGSVVTKFVTIELTVTDMTAKKVMYSTLDNQMFFDEFNKEIVKVALVTDGTVIYDASAETTTVVPETLQNLDSKDLTDYTTQVVITFADGGLAKTNLVSYTKIINEDDDFTVFEANGTKSGYYIMTNDIELDGSWAGNKNHSGGSGNSTFKGVFDGNGHVAEIALKAYGIFGFINNAIIKDTAFVVKQIGAKDFSYASILGYQIASSTISDCYFTYDLPSDAVIDISYYGWAQSAGLGIYNNAGAEVILNNVVIDTSSVVTDTITYDQPFAYGSILSKPNKGDNGAYHPTLTNVYVLSSNKYLGYIASVSATKNVIDAFNGIDCALFASNDITAYQDCVVVNGGAKVMLANAYRYDNMASALTAGENFASLTSSSSNLWTLDVNGELMFNGIALGDVEVNNFISNGASEYAIVVPDTLKLASPSTSLAYAVTDLHDYVSLATNGSVDLAIVKASEFNANTYTKYISVGKTGLMTADATEVLATVGQDGLFYFSEGDNIFFTGNSDNGIANGVYDFLRTYFGFEAVTDDVVNYNENVSDVSFTTLYKIDTPDIEERGINGVSAWTRARYGARSGYMGYNVGGLYNASLTSYEISSMHNTLDYIPYAVHSAEHGAYWYATDINNVIISKSGSSAPLDICYTAHGDAEQYEAMINQFVSRIQDIFRQRSRIKALQVNGGYSWVKSDWDTLSIMVEDNNTVCKCSACQEAKALYGGYDSGAVIKFINQVKARIDAWFETPTGSTYKMDDFKLMFSAYHALIDAPVRYDEELKKYVPVHEDVVLADNVVVQLATSGASGLSSSHSINAPENAKGKENLEKWASMTDYINLWTYQANFELFTFFTDSFALYNEEGHKFFAENKVNFWVNQNSNAKTTGWAALKEYVSSKLMWNTDADLEEIYDTYFDSVYGTASVKMRNLFDLQREYYQKALANYIAANPSTTSYSLKLHGYYDDADLWTLVNGYREALAMVEKGSFEYLQIIKEAIAPYYQLFANHNRYGETASGKPVSNAEPMTQEILELKLEFKAMLEEYEAVYGATYRNEGNADLSSDAVFAMLGYYFKPNNKPAAMVIYSIDRLEKGSTASRVGSATKTLTQGIHDIGWQYGYPDGSGFSGLAFKNFRIDVISGSNVVELTVGVNSLGEELMYKGSPYIDQDGYIRELAGVSGRYDYGTINCLEAGTAVLRLSYDLDGITYKYDLTITVE